MKWYQTLAANHLLIIHRQTAASNLPLPTLIPHTRTHRAEKNLSPALKTVQSKYVCNENKMRKQRVRASGDKRIP